MANKAKNKKSNVKVNRNKKKVQVRKTRGTALTIALVLIVVHSILAAILYSGLSNAPEVQRPWILSLMVLHSLLNIAAAVGIFYWKTWGMYVYAASAIIALVVGLVSIGAWSVFYMVLPVAILGWLLRTKWDYFE